MKIKIDIDNAASEPLALKLGWQKTLFENFVEKPNPQTAEDYVTSVVRNFLAGHIAELNLQTSRKTAEDEALQKVTKTKGA